MAAGDVWNKVDATVGAAEFFDMQTTSGTESVIHNITVNPTASTSTTALEYWDGTDSFVVDTITGSGSWMGMFLHNTNTKWYRVNPTDATNTKICCDGVQTK